MCVRGRPILVGNQIGIILMDRPKHISIVIAARNHLLSTPHREISRRVDLRDNLRQQHAALLPDLTSSAAVTRPPGPARSCPMVHHGTRVRVRERVLTRVRMATHVRVLQYRPAGRLVQNTVAKAEQLLQYIVN